MPEVPQRPPIAVVGVSALFPGSQDATGFWRDILAGRDLVTEVPPTHWLVEDYFDPDPSAPDKTYARRGAFLQPTRFDPLEHGIPPSILPATDTTQLLALIAANQVLDDAIGGQFTHVSREKTSVILGATSALELVGTMTSRLQKPVWLKALREHGVPEDEAQKICERISSSYVPWQESTFPGLLGNVIAGRIANRLNLGGTNCVADAACASALSALAMAVNELHLGLSDLVITGGADTFNDIFMYMCFSKTPALSPTGDCRPFAANADGTLLGEGIGLFALRRLEDAERDGDRIYAVIRGVGSGSDGRAKSIYAPLPEGQARALRRAYEGAGYGPETVELVEAHGTGTKAGDAAEFEGLRQVFGATPRTDTQWCALGSVKSQIGHTKAAAGAAGFFKAVMALHHKALPPTLKVDAPNPALKVDESPFYLNTRTRPWIRDDAHPRRASVSSFGFGGSNFHVTLEEYTGPSRAYRVRTAPTELVLVSAPDATALSAACRGLATDGASLADVARASQQAFDVAQPARAAIVAESLDDLRRKLDRVAASPAAGHSPDGVSVGLGAAAGPVAFLFPGQGSQYVGMGADLALAFDAARGVWDRTAALKLHDRVFPRPVFTDEAREQQEKALTATEWAQPSIGAASLAQLALLRAIGVEASATAGHSFGEITALCAAGVLEEADALRVARRRGELMAAAADRPGSMIAVVATRDEIEPLLAGTDVVVANHNAPKQVVLSGASAAVDALAGRLRERGLTVRPLPVATAFHSPIVAAAADAFGAFLSEVHFGAPAVPVYANSTAAPYEAAAARATLAGQIARPVRFVEEIEALYAAGLRTFVEVGPGAVLTRLVGEILGDRPHVAVSLDRKGAHGVTAFWQGLGRLAAAGVAFDTAPLWADAAPAKVAKPKRAGASVTLTGSNYGKPYPPAGGAEARPRPVAAKPIAAAPVPAPSAAAPVPAPPVVAPAPVVAAAPAADAAWLQTFAQLQKQTADAHAAWQTAMADAHGAFLRASETSFQALASLAHVGGAPLAAPAISASPTIAAPAPSSFGVPTPAIAPVPVVAPVVAPAVAAPAPAPAPPALGLQDTLLAVVAEKTGYPPSMLTLEMELEADLGIDSIKRVEILSGLQERVAGLPDVAPSDMAQLRTLGQILSRLGGSAAPQAARVETPAVAATPPAPQPAAPNGSLRELLLGVVAEKTGYPANMLALDMELEADLGIDSIKRVEILSTLQDRAPGLPEVKPSEMSTLRTLGQIVERMNGVGEAAAARAIAPAAPAPPATDLRSTLLAVVAEKTGYPADALGLEMELEADLGIDSIKRVEILSALQDRVPGLPELPPSQMSSLRTLAHVLEFLGGGGPAPAPPPPAPAPAPKHTAAPVGRHVVRAVPAPAPGLGLAGLLRDEPIAIVPDDRGIAPALATRLRALGLAAEIVTEPAAAFGAVIHLRALGRAADAHRDALAWARALAPRAAAETVAFVTVQDTGGRFGLDGLDADAAWSAGLPGLVKTAAQEWPTAGTKSIDVELGGRTADEVAAVIVAELLAGGSDLEVGLAADGTRTRLECGTDATAATDDAALAALRGRPVLVSGGARGVTVACLEALAREAAPRLVLLGRTALAPEPDASRGVSGEAALGEALLADARRRGAPLAPAELRRAVRDVLAVREVEATLALLRTAGAEARYVACDARDPVALRAALEPVRAEWGPFAGLVHAAGVLADKLIADKTPEMFDAVFSTKVDGLRALLDATASDPLRVILLFSSVAGRSGNAGQSDYAMANEVLNKVAQAEARRRGPSCLVRALGWGPWDGGMVTPALRARFEAAGVPLVTRETGARLFVEELRRPTGPAEVVLGGAPRPVPLVSASSNRQAAFDVLVSAATHPHLRDHAVAGVPVVPAALVLEWFARAATAARPDLHLVRVEGLRVLRGIRLESFERGHRFRLACRELANGSRSRLALELRSGDVLHYSALADLEPVAPATTEVLGNVPVGSLDLARAYAGPLFHGPAFRALRAAHLADENGLSAARLAGAVALGWPGGAGMTDAAAVDGAIQLALVWVAQATGRRSLPTSLGAWRALGAGTPSRCELRVRERAAHRVVFDARLATDDGRVVAALDALEMHAIASGDAAPAGEAVPADIASV